MDGSGCCDFYGHCRRCRFVYVFCFIDSPRSAASYNCSACANARTYAQSASAASAKSASAASAKPAATTSAKPTSACTNRVVLLQRSQRRRRTLVVVS